MEKKSTYEKKSRKNSWKYLRKISGKIRKNLRRSSRKNQGKIYETLFFRLFCDPDFQLEQLTTNSFDHSGTGFAYPACSAFSCLT